jgi:transposase
MKKYSRKIELIESDRAYLESLVRSRTEQAQTVQRARILLLRAGGITMEMIADKVGININSVKLCLNKYKEGGVENALVDAPGRGRNPEITDEEKTWIINIACQRPWDLGCPAEIWTYTKLTDYINENAEVAGHIRLCTISRIGVRKILEQVKIKPFKIRYYCENRDPEFEEKMQKLIRSL